MSNSWPGTMVVPRYSNALRRNWVCLRCRALSTLPERRPSQKLPTSSARTRFAPSPTGYLHLGSLRTALFNYLTAKATGGQFILRIEDTDKKRLVADAESRLYQDLKWAGLQWDEGPDIGGPFGPYKQSERSLLYRSHAEKLLDSGHAYRCFCSTERLASLAKKRNNLGLPSDYDRTCAYIPKEEADERASKGESHILRLRLPDFTPSYTDLVYGIVSQRRKSKEKLQSQRPQPSYEDPVLIKSDGLPTYHLANVVDDHLMGITHVIRAVEWMSSTPKHILMYNAFNWEPPTFAHVGLLQNDSRQKLSKRDLSLDIRSFKEDGIFAEALLNYVALFGWSHRLGDDYLPLEDLIQNFDLKFTKGNTIAAPNKLMHFQQRYAQKYVEQGREPYSAMINKVLSVVEQHLEANPGTRFCPQAELKDRVAALLRVDAANYTTPREFFDRNSQFLCFEPRKEYKHRANDGMFKDELRAISKVFTGIPSGQWDEVHLRQALVAFRETLSAKLNHHYAQDFDDPMKVFSIAEQHFLRWALVGGRPGPTLIATMILLGKDVSLHRIEDAVGSIDSVFPDGKQT